MSPPQLRASSYLAGCLTGGDDDFNDLLQPFLIARLLIFLLSISAMEQYLTMSILYSDLLEVLHWHRHDSILSAIFRVLAGRYLHLIWQRFTPWVIPK